MSITRPVFRNPSILQKNEGKFPWCSKSYDEEFQNSHTTSILKFADMKHNQSENFLVDASHLNEIETVDPPFQIPIH